MGCAPPSGAANTENDPPTSSARRRRLVRPLPVMSAGIPRPLSLTSIVRSSSTLIVTVSAVEFAWRMALLTASRTTASAWSAKVASITDSGPLYCTDVRTPEPGKAPTASSTRCLSLVIPEGPSFRSKMVVRMSWAAVSATAWNRGGHHHVEIRGGVTVQFEDREVVRLGWVGKTMHLRLPAERSQCQHTVIQGRSAAQRQIASIWVGLREKQIGIGVEVHALIPHSPLPRLRVVDRRRAARKRERRRHGLEIGEFIVHLGTLHGLITAIQAAPHGGLLQRAQRPLLVTSSAAPRM